jgi:hypothetical protein
MAGRMKNTIRIGGGSGFWGDTDTGPVQLVERGEIDYLVFDYLAEITMSLLTRARAKNPALGYATDFVTKVMPSIADEVGRRGIRIVTNAGGVNPHGCRAALETLLREKGIEARIAVVVGDDVSGQVEDFRASGIREMFTGAPLPDVLTSASAYLGARPIAEALDAGADIVITGRCVDSAVVLGPLMHEFGWKDDDFDRLSAGSLLGHLIECGCQSTGGVFSDWQDVDGWDDMGFPIVECHPDGSGVLCKVDGTGGLVNVATVGEQMLYEVGDPRAYLLPDVVCDWSEVTLIQDGPNQVAISGAKGTPPPSTYKVCATYQDGWRATTTLTVVGGDAAVKARRVGESIIARCRRLLGKAGLGDYTETSIELVGADEMYGSSARSFKPREVMLKIAVHHSDRRAVDIFCHEVMPALTATAPGIAGFFAGRPSPVPVVRLFSMLIGKSAVPVTVEIAGKTDKVDVAAFPDAPPPRCPAPRTDEPKIADDIVAVPLSRLAYARSGDKGNNANIAVIARQPEYFDILRDYLTEQVIEGAFAHFLEGYVERFDVPGIGAFNFVLHNVLGGGGIASLRIDPQGKCFAPILLDLALEVPIAVAQEKGLC